MCERLKQTVLKTVIPERVSGVRIPLPPPDSPQPRELFSDSLRIARFRGLFALPKIKKRAPARQWNLCFGGFSLIGKSAVPFSMPLQCRKNGVKSNR
jgi:hypothetical protein